MLLLTACALQAQLTTGSLGGVVVDPAARPLPGVALQLSGVSGIRITAVSGTDGRFQFDHIPAGSYQLRLQRAGFEIRTITQIDVDVAQQPRLPATTLVSCRG